jgi:Kef-type K+ transport system membrane component KefB
VTDFFNHLQHEFNIPLANPVLIFALILFIILLSPIILRRLNIPSIIGLIISGLVIGPNGLGILEKTVAINLFSTIGLLYIMFIAGLELDMNEIRSYRNRSLLFGLFTFCIPIAIGFPVCRYFLGYDFNASLLTASMFATHTLMAYPIVSKFGISKNQAVAVSVGGTILTDTAVLIILAVIMANFNGKLNADFWIKLCISLSIFSAIVFLLIPRIAKWFFTRLESEKHSHYIFVLSVVFFSAFLAEVAGVEPIIGAFAAGLALNRLIPHSSALMNRIEFIGNSLFIPFFLISVGMIVDLSVLFKGPKAIIIALTLSVVALIGKWLAAFIAQKSFGYSREQRTLIFGLSSAHAAATLAVVLVGFNAGILDENILNGTIILILITCLVASFATELAAKKIVSRGDELSIEVKKSYKNEHILLPSTDSEYFDKMLELSMIMKDKKSANPISILSVVSNDDEAETNIYRSRQKLQDYVAMGSASETKVNILTTIDHNVTSGIIRMSREVMADLIVLPWPTKSGIVDLILGEKIEGILDGSDKTVMVTLINKPIVAFTKIVVCVPPLAERELGFTQWISKITNLSREINKPMEFVCNEVTKQSLTNFLRSLGVVGDIKYQNFEYWDDFFLISRHVDEDDLLILVSARNGSVSHMNLLDQLPLKMEKYFSQNSILVIYPQLHQSMILTEDINSKPISKGVEAVQKIGKEIRDLFRLRKK